MKIFDRCAGALLAVIAAGIIPAEALTVTTEAGGLREAVGDNVDVTSLVVSGNINAADFDFISLEMKHLNNLDLSGATIVAYSGEATFNGRTASAPLTIPEGGLMSVKAAVIHLPSTLNHIEQGGLADIDATTIVLPRYLQSIGRLAFSNSRNLENIIIPASVTHIGEGAFSGCTALKQVDIVGNVDTIPASAFSGCGSLASVSLPGGLKAIADDAFAGCKSLATLAFPASLASIGNRAFYGTGLQSVDLSPCRSITEIGDWAFASAASLQSVTFPETLVKLGKGVFFSDSSLGLTQVPPTLREIDDFALIGIGSAPSDVIASTAVEHIGNYGIAGWKNVGKFVLPSNLDYMGDGAMAGWSALQILSAESVVDVPLLGRDVWKGIDPSKVVLYVPRDLYPEYASTPQWKKFNIQAGSTGSDTPVVAPADAAVSARFEGMTLHLTAPVEIAGVEIFDAAGRSFSLPSQGAGCEMAVDTSAWNSPVMIVRVVMTDGSAAALKLSR